LAEREGFGGERSETWKGFAPRAVSVSELLEA